MMELFKGTVTPKDWAAVGAILAVALVLAVVFVAVVHKGQQRTIEQITGEDKVVLADLAKARENERDIGALREEAEKTTQLVTHFEERLPLGREIPLFVKQFEGMAAEVDLNIALTPLPPTKDTTKFLETIPYTVNARGTFHQVASFVNRLERFTRYLKISDLKMKIAKEDASLCEAKFTLSTFRFLQAGPSGEALAGASASAGARS